MHLSWFAVFPVIVARVIHQDPDLTDFQSEEEEVVTVFQFEHYFMDCCRSVSRINMLILKTIITRTVRQLVGGIHISSAVKIIVDMIFARLC